jgi:mono/diheme cytochrome c family protein
LKSSRPCHRWRKVALAALAACLLLGAGCRNEMHDQPRYKPYRESAFFPDRTSAREPVEGTVARGQLQDDPHFYLGQENGEEARTMPFPVTEQVLARGRERYDIFCAPCHGRVGDGRGMVVLRGFRAPASFHSERLREEPVGHFFEAATFGFGSMPAYASRVPAADRWAIAAYIRALQLSQRATVEDAPEEERRRLQETRQR